MAAAAAAATFYDIVETAGDGSSVDFAQFKGKGEHRHACPANRGHSSTADDAAAVPPTAQAPIHIKAAALSLSEY
jgi:hypothetical protein